MFNKIFTALLIVILIIFFISPAVLAQETNSQEDIENNSQIVEQNQEADENEEAVYINAQNLDYQDEKTILSGGLEIRKDDTEIESEEGELFREENKMILKKNIRVEYPDGKVSSELLTAFLKSEEYIFENNVKLDYILQNQEGSLFLTSNYLKIYGENNNFTAEENIVIDYEDQKFKGDKAEYNGDAEELLLTGNVTIEEGEDWIKSDRAVFKLGEDEEGYQAEGNVEIKMILE